MPKYLSPEEKVREIINDFDMYIKYRYPQIRDNELKLKSMFSRLRNHFFELPNSLCCTGLVSLEAENLKKSERVHDHIYPRTICAKNTILHLIKNPDMTYEEKYSMILARGATVQLTREQHSVMTKNLRRSDKKNYEYYEQFGIIIPGLSKYIEDNKIWLL